MKDGFGIVMQPDGIKANDRLREIVNEQAAKLAAAEKRVAELEAGLAGLYNAALSAIYYVGAANYQER